MIFVVKKSLGSTMNIEPGKILNIYDHENDVLYEISTWTVSKFPGMDVTLISIPILRYILLVYTISGVMSSSDNKISLPE